MDSFIKDFEEKKSKWDTIHSVLNIDVPILMIHMLIACDLKISRKDYYLNTCSRLTSLKMFRYHQHRKLFSKNIWIFLFSNFYLLPIDWIDGKMLLFGILLSILICDITSAQDYENCWEKCFQVGKFTLEIH